MLAVIFNLGEQNYFWVPHISAQVLTCLNCCGHVQPECPAAIRINSNIRAAGPGQGLWALTPGLVKDGHTQAPCRKDCPTS